MIPKKLHFVWVGDESKRPDKCIDTWREKNPEYEVNIWGNEKLSTYGWFNAKHIEQMYPKELNGVADIMRYEILYREGGIALDADSMCINPLEDWLLKPDAFSHWEQELLRPGLIGCGAMGAVKNSIFFGECIKQLSAKETVTDELAWRTVGPLHITQVYIQSGLDFTVYPSHYFVPTHYAGKKYNGNGHIFADQFWGSTRGYESIS
jgi:mannosyltransferase OCH1-like enzyme